MWNFHTQNGLSKFCWREKKAGSLHFCINHRKPSTVTVFPADSVSWRDKRMNSFSNTKVFSALDATSAHCQMEMEEDAKNKTFFVTYGQSSYGKTCFELKTPNGRCNVQWQLYWTRWRGSTLYYIYKTWAYFHRRHGGVMKKLLPSWRWLRAPVSSPCWRFVSFHKCDQLP